MSIDAYSLIINILIIILLIIYFAMLMKSSKMLKEIKPEFDELNKKLDGIHNNLKQHMRDTAVNTKQHPT